MSSLTSFIESGILELYVMGMASDEEIDEVERMAAAYKEVRKEIREISKTLEAYAQANAVTPNPHVKPLLLATIDYIERMQNGEQHSIPPELTESSKPEDFAEWLERSDMYAPEGFDSIFAKIIGYTPKATTAVIWLSDTTSQEIHDDEHEGFLILEGACDLMIEDKVHKLAPGDYLQIPLHARHSIKVTSTVPCKAILQRLST